MTPCPLGAARGVAVPFAWIWAAFLSTRSNDPVRPWASRRWAAVVRRAPLSRSSPPVRRIGSPSYAEEENRLSLNCLEAAMRSSAARASPGLGFLSKRACAMATSSRMFACHRVLTSANLKLDSCQTVLSRPIDTKSRMERSCPRSLSPHTKRPALPIAVGRAVCVPESLEEGLIFAGAVLALRASDHAGQLLDCKISCLGELLVHECAGFLNCGVATMLGQELGNCRFVVSDLDERGEAALVCQNLGIDLLKR